jgi:hypothetical protein
VGRGSGEVEQDNIQIAGEGEVLKAIVEQVQGRLKPLLGDDPRAKAVSANKDGHAGQRSGEQGGFVTHLPGIGAALGAGFKDDEPFSSTPPVTVRENARPMPGAQQSVGYQDHQRSLACSAYAQIAHTYHRAIQAPGF